MKIRIVDQAPGLGAYFLTTGKSNWILYRATVKVRANASPTEEPYAGKPHVRV